MSSEPPNPGPEQVPPEQAGGGGGSDRPKVSGRRAGRKRKRGPLPIPWVQQVTVSVPHWMLEKLHKWARSMNSTIDEVVSQILESVDLMEPEEAAFGTCQPRPVEIYAKARGSDRELPPVLCHAPVSMQFYRRLSRWSEESGVPEEELVWQVLARNFLNQGALAAAFAACYGEYERRKQAFRQEIVIPPVVTPLAGPPPAPPPAGGSV